ncbi:MULTISPECIES: serine hydrolase [Amycolatopsis]|uniref:CubicO group peptidase (Beta-lactamase class C family) n=1 Tax=Amycolatopsis echigonensis TaxID=2576905 RepID=A0A2N3WNR2_9PSEU|nr:MULTISPECIES: serine hydrolase domain-containing protein [Amycolatopsis]PKV95508.1 CubicO group peptidase (beta-lactamase class C family) [Amycolatopsis niigatensis]
MSRHFDGLVSAGFEPVADAFGANFDRRGDTAASCVVYADGKPVVDLSAGETDRGRWTPDTRSVVFSVSKGVTTVCVLMAVERGLIELDAAVAKYWPEFADNGKETTTVRQLLAHQAGLVAPEADLTADDLRAWHPVVDRLARQAPAWIPGTTFAYHAITFGWLAGEVLRRASGQRPSEWLRDHVAGPLNLAMTYGADLADPDFCPMLEPLPNTEPAEAIDELLAQPMAVRAMSLGGLFDPANMTESANGPDYLTPEIPGANLVANARSLARLYAATVGEVDGIRLLAPDTVSDAAAVRSKGKPFIGPAEGNRWGTGFMLASTRRGMAGPGSFGHDGLGGQLAFAHPETRIAFAYQTARPGGVPDDRAEALCRALRTCL